jgi:hypothetical protein
VQVACLLDVTEDAVEEMHGHELHPWQEDDRRWRYRPEDVAQVLKRRSAPDPAGEGKVAAKSFAMFDEGRRMADIVVATEQSPATIKRLCADYLEMAGGMLLSRANVEALRGLLGADATAVSDGLAGAVAKELDRRFVEGREEGKAEAEDFGEVVDFKTGERRRLPPR